MGQEFETHELNIQPQAWSYRCIFPFELQTMVCYC